MKSLASLFALLAGLTQLDDRNTSEFATHPRKTQSYPTCYGDYNGDGTHDTAFFVPAPPDSFAGYRSEMEPDPWRFFIRFSDPTLDSIPVHYTYDLYTTQDLDGDRADELLLVQPIAKYYRVMSFDKSEQRWKQLLHMSSPRQNTKPAEWLYTRNDTLFYLANRSHEIPMPDKWEWFKM